MFLLSRLLCLASRSCCCVQLIYLASETLYCFCIFVFVSEILWTLQQSFLHLGCQPPTNSSKALRLWGCTTGCLQHLEILEITWNFIDVPGKFNCQLKYDNMPITEPNLVTSLNPRNCHLTIYCAVLFIMSSITESALCLCPVLYYFGGSINVKILLKLR